MSDPEQQRDQEAKVRGELRKCVRCACRELRLSQHHANEKHDRHGIHAVVVPVG